MKYEIRGQPPEPDSVAAMRRDFETFLIDLESTPSRKIKVVFGIPWGIEMYDQEWPTFELTGAELRARIDAAEREGFGRIGNDDLFVTFPETGVKRTYCHETDIHIVANDRSDPYLVAHEKEWIRLGWDVYGQFDGDEHWVHLSAQKSS